MKRYIHASSGSRPKNALYIESDNGGRSVFLCLNGKWYYYDTAPNGTYGGIDVLDGSEEDAAKRIRSAIDSGELFDADDFDESDVETWNYIKEYDGMTAEDILDKENSGRDFDYTELVEI